MRVFIRPNSGMQASVRLLDAADVKIQSQVTDTDVSFRWYLNWVIIVQ